MSGLIQRDYCSIERQYLIKLEKSLSRIKDLSPLRFSRLMYLKFNELKA